MSYTIKVEAMVYDGWACYQAWWTSGVTDPESFNDWVILHYPEILLVEWDNQTDDRLFTFESENHYHWFLLRQ